MEYIQFCRGCQEIMRQKAIGKIWHPPGGYDGRPSFPKDSLPERLEDLQHDSVRIE